MDDLKQIIDTVAAANERNVVILGCDQEILDNIKLSLGIETCLISPRFSADKNIIYVIPVNKY